MLTTTNGKAGRRAASPNPDAPILLRRFDAVELDTDLGSDLDAARRTLTTVLKTRAALQCYDALVLKAQRYVRDVNDKPRRADSPLFTVYGKGESRPLPDAYDLVHDVYVMELPKLADMRLSKNMQARLLWKLKMHFRNVLERKVYNRPELFDPDWTQGDSTIPAPDKPMTYDLPTTFTTRERQVAHMRVAGYGIVEIADRLNVSDRTIKRDLVAMREKLATSVACPTSV